MNNCIHKYQQNWVVSDPVGPKLGLGDRLNKFLQLLKAQDQSLHAEKLLSSKMHKHIANGPVFFLMAPIKLQNL